MWSDKEGGDPSGTGLGFIRNRIFNSLFGGNIPNTFRTNGFWGYPRAEKVAPSMDRTDSMVSIPLLAGNCSSIQIDWTWSNGAAEFQTADATPLLATLPATLNTSPLIRPVPISNIPLAGLSMVNWPVQPLFMPTAASPSGAFPITSGVAAKIPWFGLPDSIFPMAQRRGVTMLGGALPNSKAAPLQLAQSGTVPPDPRAASYATPIQILKPTVATDPKKIIPFTALDVDTIAIATPPIDCARIEGSNGIGFPLDVVQPAAKYSSTPIKPSLVPMATSPIQKRTIQVAANDFCELITRRGQPRCVSPSHCTIPNWLFRKGVSFNLWWIYQRRIKNEIIHAPACIEYTFFTGYVSNWKQGETNAFTLCVLSFFISTIHYEIFYMPVAPRQRFSVGVRNVGAIGAYRHGVFV